MYMNTLQNTLLSILRLTVKKNIPKIHDKFLLVIYFLLALKKKRKSIDEYMQRLQFLAKECDFKSVFATQNRDDCDRDVFITGLCSNILQQQLLENNTLLINIAIDQARALHAALKTFRRRHIPSITNCRGQFLWKMP